MNIKEIYIFGKFYKKMSLNGRPEKIYKCDNFSIKLDDGIEINAIGYLNDDGYYFNILAVYKNNKIYRSPKYHLKYIILVRDGIFDYYKANK